MADFLEEKRSEIGARLKELTPLVEEYNRLEAAAAAFEGVPTASLETTAWDRGATHRQATTARRGDAHSVIKTAGASDGQRHAGQGGACTRPGEPGDYDPEIAEKIGIRQNYLYTVLPSLQQQGLVSKHGRGWHPKQLTDPTAQPISIWG